MSNDTLNKMAENARELGLDYEPAQPKYRRGDRLICLETEEYCVIHISGTDRQWVKFPDTHIGVYKNEQLAELFELLPKEIEIEQPAQQQGPVGEITAEDMGRPFNAIRIGTHFYKEVPPVGTKLYTSPPAQRTWVGLTDEEKRQIFEREDYQGWLDYINAIEAKLRSKNEDRN